jgi:hypothetical protein
MNSASLADALACTKFLKNKEKTVLETFPRVAGSSSADLLLPDRAREVYDMKSVLRLGRRKLNVLSVMLSAMAGEASGITPMRAALAAPRIMSWKR